MTIKENQNDVTVSVCMITYNHEKYISQAIEGVLIQKCNFSVELVIGEDCSTDNTKNICNEYARTNSNIKLLPSEKNIGIMPNFIRTLQACTGKYIALCEGDDYWTDPYKLQKQVDFLERNPVYVMVHTAFRTINEEGATIKKFLKRKQIKDSGNIIKQLARRNFIMTLTVVVRKGIIIKAIEELNKSASFSIIDYAIFFEIAGMGKVFYMDEITATYRVLTNSASHFNNVEKRIAFIKNIVKIKKYYNQKYFLGKDDNYFCRGLHTAMLKEYAVNKNTKKFFLMFKEGLKEDIRNWFNIINYIHMLLLFTTKRRIKK